MMEFLTAGPNLPFTIALSLMFTIALIEVIGTLMGAGLSDLLDSILPDTDIDVSMDGPEVETPSVLSSLLGWLLIGQVPIMILLVVFLTTFGLIGLFIQTMTLSIMGSMLPAFVVSIPAFIISLPVMKILGSLLAQIMPKDETSAVSEETFVGKMATIVLGTAKRGQPAQARLQDQYGQTHYVMVEPDTEDDLFETGTTVVLVDRSGAVFLAVRWVE